MFLSQDQHHIIPLPVLDKTTSGLHCAFKHYNTRTWLDLCYGSVYMHTVQFLIGVERFVSLQHDNAQGSRQVFIKDNRQTKGATEQGTFVSLTVSNK
jgi:hypothetical protein